MPADTPTALLIVRCEVNADLREEFDRWYQAEHLPDATAAFEARTATRYWSVTDDNVHFAIYGFDDPTHLERVMNGPVLAGQVAEFDRCWPEGVSRTREVLHLMQALTR